MNIKTYKSTKNLKSYQKGVRSGFVVLFAIIISSIVLSIALGVASIGFKQLIFTTSAKNSNDAFYAADSAAECALYYDQNALEGEIIAFGNPTRERTTECAGRYVELNRGSGTKEDPFVFDLYPLGVADKGCAKVNLWRETKVLDAGEIKEVDPLDNNLNNGTPDIGNPDRGNQPPDPSAPTSITTTTINSKGYNIYDSGSDDCSFRGVNRVERYIEVTY